MSIELFSALLDGTAVVQASVVAYKNPEDPTDKALVASTMTKELVDLNVPAAAAPQIGGFFSDAVEAAGNGSQAPADILNDFNTALAAHAIVLPSIAQYFLMIAVTQAITYLQAFIAGKK